VHARIKSLFSLELSWKRVVRSGILIPLFVYLGLFMLAWLIPDKLIFRPPQPSYTDDPHAIKLQTSDGETIAAKFYQNEVATFTILFSHGNAEDIGYVEPFAKQLRDSGFAVLTYDYRGYGLSDGSASEDNAYRDIDAAYDHLVKERGVPPENIVVHGRSLGGGVAVDLAARRPVCGLILESTFTSTSRVLTGFRIFPFEKFDNIGKIASVGCPVLVIHGKLDSTIPFHHGEALFAAIKSPKTSLWIGDAGHNDLFYKSRQRYLEAIVEFSKTLR
jgi:fermentation-respiration switch protein FrsA (DUF1100 family)